MPEPITITQLQDASADAITLDQVLNGTDTQDVTSRQGRTYPTLAKALKLISQHGIIGATVFERKSELAQSSLANDSYAVITNDTEELNGIYRLKQGIWVKQTYNANDLSRFINNFSPYNRKNLFEWSDVNGKIAMLLDSDGRLKITGLKEDIQSIIKSLQKTQYTAEESLEFMQSGSHLLTLCDNEGKVAFAVDCSGNVLAKEKSLNIERPYYIRPKNNEVSHMLHQSVAPLPMSFVQMDFSPPDELKNKKISQQQSIVIDTIYRDNDHVVHPTILEFFSGFNGSRYWLGITPYYKTNDDFENPFIYQASELGKYHLNTDFPQPLADRQKDNKSYNSDIFFTYDFNQGQLMACWRYTDKTLNTNKIYGRRTRDGIKWSEPELLHEGSTSLLSPSIVFDPLSKQYLLFCVESNGGSYGIARYVSKSLKGSWVRSSFSQINSVAAISPWHIEVKYVGNKLCCLINDNQSTKNLYFGISDDLGLSFSFGEAMLEGTHENPYKATFTPVYNENQIALVIQWTSDHTSPDTSKHWKLYSDQTTFSTISGV